MSFTHAMTREIEIRLARDVVAPLVDWLRRDLDTLQQSAQPNDNAVPGPAIADIAQFVALFPPDFPATNAIRVTSHDVPPTLRACTYLRLRLRRTDLSAISDADLQHADKVESLKSRSDVPWQLYLFLATIQVIVLQHFAVQTPSPWLSPITNLLLRLRGKQSGKRAPSAEPEPSAPDATTQVVVLNDPVNLMQYVTYLFQTVVGLSAEEAERHMRAIHEQQSSIVWRGARDEAEELVRKLRSWHLTAELRDTAQSDQKAGSIN